MIPALKSVMAFFKTVVIFFTSFTQLLLPFAQKTVKGGEQAFFEKWSVDQAYTREYAVELEKDPSKDFVVLNLADIQLNDIESFDVNGDTAYKTVEKLINDVNPDLITLSGDNAWQTYAYIKLVKEIDSYGIPWAPVMGNHDGQGTPGEFWCASQFANAKNCLFKFGPEDMGYGNYIINITENGEIIHTLFMMDTHSGAKDTPAGAINGTDYDGLWANQMDWYKWAVQGIANEAGKTVESSIIIHIPIYQYRLAWDMMGDNETRTIKDEYKDVAYGYNREDIWSPDADNGFFEILKSLDSTKNIIAGHDHRNNFSIPYEGVRLTYGLKCGAGCYWDEDLNGGTTLTIGSDGHAEVEHIFVDATDFKNIISIDLGHGGIC